MKRYLLIISLIVLALCFTVSCATKVTTEPVVEEVKALESSVNDIQKYGNLVLSITKSDMDSIGAEYGDVFTISLGDETLEAPYCTSYSDVDLGNLVLRNDGDIMILAINMGDFASTYGIATKVTNPDKTYKWVFEEGKKLDVTGTSKGKGTQGNIKRHGHHRGPMSHGSKHKRLAGALAAGTYPSRVFKGNAGPGRMGRETVTVQNVELVKVIEEKNLMLIKGAVPGNKGGIVRIQYAVKGQK